ncbi:CFEM domain-containing protein [Fusarium falciforme]|uniref:CFEM domain-containing protein n=1 Tax=Fusarium falciforme TaxID=195108 RepID=UPI002300E8AB|nr:CFEM domain-containing protein [Fusarium falciforme]WAO84940.1 CFEM domain-containing protein [Fusarium falciforme]
MKSVTSVSLLLLSGLASSLAQDSTKASPDTASLTLASGTASTSGTSHEVEKEHARCFQDCYRKYGSFPNCSLGKDKFFECWCDEDDWVEREEDCVWDVCGVDAYNSYGDIQRSLCAKVEAPSSKVTKTATSTSTEARTSQTTAHSESTSSASAQTGATTSETSTTSDSSSASSASSAVTQHETAGATQEPNGGVAGLASGAKAGLVVVVTYLVFMIL